MRSTAIANQAFFSEVLEDEKVIHSHFSYTSTSRMPYPPIDLRTQERKRSFCSFTDGTPTHTFAHILGQGSFGTTRLMEPVDDNFKPIVIKVFTPPTTYSINTTNENIIAITSSRYQNFKNEIPFHAKYTGVCGSFCTNDPIIIRSTESEKTVVSHPRGYIATEYIRGKTLKKYIIDSQAKFFLLCLEILKNLEELHQLFMHLDIHPENIMVSENPDGISVSFVDFSFSRFSENDSLDLFGMNLQIKPPEYQNKKSIKPHRNQDVFCTGLTLREILFSCDFLFTPEQSKQIKKILRDMRATIPENRPTTLQAYSRFMDMIAELMLNKVFQENLLYSPSEFSVQIFQHLFRFKKTMLEDKIISNPDSKTVDQLVFFEAYLLKMNHADGLQPGEILTDYLGIIASNDPTLIGKSYYLKMINPAGLECQILNSLKSLAPACRIHFLNHLTLTWHTNFITFLHALPKKSDQIYFFITAKMRQIERNFPDHGAIENWCYYANYLNKLAHANEVESELFDEIYLSEPNVVPSNASLQFIANTKTATALIITLQVSLQNDRVTILQYLNQIDPAYLARTIHTLNDKQTLFNLIPSKIERERLINLRLDSRFYSLQQKLTEESILNSKEAFLKLILEEFATVPDKYRMEFIRRIGDPIKNAMTTLNDISAILKALPLHQKEFLRFLGEDFLTKKTELSQLSYIDLKAYIEIIDFTFNNPSQHLSRELLIDYARSFIGVKNQKLDATIKNLDKTFSIKPYQKTKDALYRRLSKAITDVHQFKSGLLPKRIGFFSKLLPNQSLKKNTVAPLGPIEFKH